VPFRTAIVFVLFLTAALFAQLPPTPSGDAVLRAKWGRSEIAITTTTRLAGAIHSLTWKGKEFIDSADHGRQLQSAASFDCAKPGEFWAECFNPTEAGSRLDGAGPKSTSKLLSLSVKNGELTTTTQMAHWLAPGEKSSDRPALNQTTLSDHRVTKRVKIGYQNLPNVIEYDVTYEVPKTERHTFAQFEAVTGYMPAEFSRFWKYDRKSARLEKLDDGPGEQSQPVVFTTESGSHAMGVFSPDQPSKGFEKAGYGRFRFTEEKVVKWNCVFRTRNADGISPGEYRFRSFVVIGSQLEVQKTLASLLAMFPKP
jgi:hypothetical protein